MTTSEGSSLEDQETEPVRGHLFFVEGETVVVEWYHFGEDVSYEFAIQLRFDPAAQVRLAKAVGQSPQTGPALLLQKLRERFGTYYRVREFADELRIPYDHRRDLTP